VSETPRTDAVYQKVFEMPGEMWGQNEIEILYQHSCVLERELADSKTECERLRGEIADMQRRLDCAALVPPSADQSQGANTQGDAGNMGDM
jgi:hypothetical protein